MRAPALADATDAELAVHAAQGHPSAPAAVWDRFATLVRGVLRRSLGPRAEVEDHVQEVFLRFFKQVKTLREPESVRAFVIGIAIRVARGELRRRRIRRWLRLTDDGALPELRAEAGDADAREAVSRLYAILDGFDDKLRLVFVLRHVEELELVEVAAALETSLATVKRQLAKVTARLDAIAERDPLLSAFIHREEA